MNLEALKNQLGLKLSVAAADLETHGKDESYPLRCSPLAVVFADSLEDIAITITWAREEQIPIIPFGAGTSLEGQVIPVGNAISLDVSRMNKILEIRPEDFICVVEMNLTGCILGHVGDGNFHTLLVCEPNDPRAEVFSQALVEHTLGLGGTCTGEHGVGLRKKKYLLREHGAALGWMRQIKQLFDPQSILNPTKIF
jgi:FAD/FMN-containing dehydrogenase